MLPGIGLAGSSKCMRSFASTCSWDLLQDCNPLSPARRSLNETIPVSADQSFFRGFPSEAPILAYAPTDRNRLLQGQQGRNRLAVALMSLCCRAAVVVNRFAPCHIDSAGMGA